MVQEIAQEIIRSARKKGAQDIYFVPKLDAYELHMRVGDERCKIGSYDFEKFAAVISHFNPNHSYLSQLDVTYKTPDL
ncbi:TPA: hypothetical protein VW005_001816, partial [Streptococcus pneumoniae]|nr:hypothetical protein [Streptococcus pneumoniae]